MKRDVASAGCRVEQRHGARHQRQPEIALPHRTRTQPPLAGIGCLWLRVMRHLVLLRFGLFSRCHRDDPLPPSLNTRYEVCFRTAASRPDLGHAHDKVRNRCCETWIKLCRNLVEFLRECQPDRAGLRCQNIRLLAASSWSALAVTSQLCTLIERVFDI